MSNNDTEINDRYSKASPNYDESIQAEDIQNTIQAGTQIRESGADTTKNRNAKTNFNLFKLPRRKKLILVSSTLNRLLLTYSIAIFNPLFPDEAKQKGLGSFEISVAFGVLYAIVFITAPIFGKYLVFLGPNFVFISSLYVAGVANFLFAYLHFSSGSSTHFVLIIAVRCILALSYSGSSTVTQSVVSYEFQEHIGKANGILQSGVIFGYILGPAISGFLYEVGGYILPFCVIGGLDCLYGCFVVCTLPPLNATGDSNGDKTIDLSIWKLFQSPLIVTSLVCITSGAMGMSNVDATLTLHLIPFGISMGSIGLIFALVDFVNAITNIICAYLIDSFNVEFPAIIIGHGGIAIGFFILGPSFFLTEYIPQHLTTIYIALVIIGTGFGISLISLLKCMIRGVEELGYDQHDLKVMAAVSGIFNSVIMLGGFLGQFAIGIVASSYSDVVGYTVIAFINAGCCIVAVILFIVRKKSKRTLEPSGTPQIIQ